MRRVSRLAGLSGGTHCRAARPCSRCPKPSPRSRRFVDRCRAPGGAAKALQPMCCARYRSMWQGPQSVSPRMRTLPLDVSRSGHHMTPLNGLLAGLAPVQRSTSLIPLRTSVGSALLDCPQRSLLLEALLSAKGSHGGISATAGTLAPALSADSDRGVADLDAAQILCVQHAATACPSSCAVSPRSISADPRTGSRRLTAPASPLREPALKLHQVIRSYGSQTDS